MSNKGFELTDKICLDGIAIASMAHFIYNYAGKVNNAEVQNCERKLIDAIRKHIEKCNELIALHS